MQQNERQTLCLPVVYMFVLSSETKLMSIFDKGRMDMQSTVGPAGCILKLHGCEMRRQGIDREDVNVIIFSLVKAQKMYMFRTWDGGPRPTAN